MVGPSMSQVATSVFGLMAVEKAALEIVPPLVMPWLEECFALYGRGKALMLGISLASFVSFWVIGGLMALPAIFQLSRWKIQVNRRCDLKALGKSLPLVAFNWLLSLLFITPALFYCLPESAFDLRILPSTSVLLRDVLVWMIVEETTFYYVHRWFHVNKKMYSLIHKLHHTWTSPVSLVAIYCHPVEHLCSNIGPIMAGPLLCGSHILAIGVLIIVANFHTLAVHSGYWFCDDNGMHDEHHRSFNCNYGVTGLLDMFHGTYKPAPGALQKKIEQ